MQIDPHELTFTTEELTLIKDALDILSPDTAETARRLQSLRDEVHEELYQNAKYD